MVPRGGSGDDRAVRHHRRAGTTERDDLFHHEYRLGEGWSLGGLTGADQHCQAMLPGRP
jgi:hypothetical protein